MKKKPHKNLEHKQHAIEQSMGHRRYQGDYGMSLEINTNINRIYKNQWGAAKIATESPQQYRPTSGSKKNPNKQSNFTKGIRKNMQIKPKISRRKKIISKRNVLETKNNRKYQ